MRFKHVSSFHNRKVGSFSVEFTSTDSTDKKVANLVAKTLRSTDGVTMKKKGQNAYIFTFDKDETSLEEIREVYRTTKVDAIEHVN